MPTSKSKTINIDSHPMPHWKAEIYKTFKFLQASALEAWSQDIASQQQIEIAQKLAVLLAEANAKATTGQYEGPHPSQTKGALKEGFRGWS